MPFNNLLQMYEAKLFIVNMFVKHNTALNKLGHSEENNPSDVLSGEL